MLGRDQRGHSHDRLLERLLTEYKSPYGLPTTWPSSDQFDDQRYWRGPVWMNMNWLFSEAVEELGFLKQNSLELVEKSGFFEYFSPLTGEGLGADQFTWTAALTLDWLNG